MAHVLFSKQHPIARNQDQSSCKHSKTTSAGANGNTLRESISKPLNSETLSVENRPWKFFCLNKDVPFQSMSDLLHQRYSNKFLIQEKKVALLCQRSLWERQGKPVPSGCGAPQPLSEISWSQIQALCKDLFNLGLLGAKPGYWAWQSHHDLGRLNQSFLQKSPYVYHVSRNSPGSSA
jgi:hypothetical protein